MYEQYPSGGGSAGRLPQRPPAPAPVRIAVIAMYIGAAVELITVADVLRQWGLSFTGVSGNADYWHDVAPLIIPGFIRAGVWTGTAIVNGRGHHWARIIGTVMFGLETIPAFYEMIRPDATVMNRSHDLLCWVIGLTAVILLWRRESSAYFRWSPPAPA